MGKRSPGERGARRCAAGAPEGLCHGKGGAKSKAPVPCGARGLWVVGAWQCPTFTWGSPTLSSALSSFTSEFGMGSGGSHSLWPPGKGVGEGAVRWRACLQGSVFTLGELFSIGAHHTPEVFGCYMVKPLEQLVLVSFTRYRASTPSLSTSWSPRALQGPQGSREISSWGGLPA